MKTINYYNKIIKDIEFFIKIKKYNHAFLKCKNELEMLYIPKNIEIQLINLFKEINSIYLNIQYKKFEKINTKWTLKKIKMILLYSYDEELHWLALQHLKNKNIYKIMTTLQNYLLNNTYRNDNKIHLLFILKENNFNKKIKVKKTNGIFSLNPIQMINFEEHKKVKKIYKLLNNYIYNDNPSLYNNCLYILQNYYYTLYPYFVDKKEENDLTAAIVYKVYLLQFNNIEIKEIIKKFHSSIKIINKYLSILENEKIC